MHQNLSSVLFPVYRRRILGLLLLRPEDALHGREIARRTGLSAGTVTRELTGLAAVGLLKRERRGNQQVYSADIASPIYSELASILRKTSGIAEVIAQVLIPLEPLLRVAFIFGSVARGEETTGSDIDLMLIGDITFREAVESLYPAQQTVGREINSQVLSAKEFHAKAHKDQYLAELIARPKIFVIGTEHDLEELVRHKP